MKLGSLSASIVDDGTGHFSRMAHRRSEQAVKRRLPVKRIVIDHEPISHITYLHPIK
jgi:hypothetical protein